MTWQHPVRAKLAAGEPVYAATVTTANLDSAALLANLGFDFLWVEMEHSPVTLESLRNMILVTRSLPAAVFARVPVIDLWTAKRVLDQGVSGVIFPFTSNAQLAQRAANACRYPPTGLRGSGAGLATSTWPDTELYYDSADRHVVVMTVIEEACAVDCIDEIAATPGLDVLFIGTSDLSFSLGLRGRQSEPSLQAAIDKIAAAARRNNKFLGRPAGTPEQVLDYRNQGFQVFQCLTDLGMLTLGARQILKSFGRLPAEETPAPVQREQPKALY